MNATLDNREERLCMTPLALAEPLELVYTTIEPTHTALARVASSLIIALSRNHVVELHDHVGTKVALDLHHRLWGKAVARPVDVTAKFHAVLVHGSQRRQ